MNKPFLTSLETLRGLAALSVAWIHCWVVMVPATEYTWENLSLTDFGRLLGFLLISPFSGRNAVVFFFVLSGFVLALSLKVRLFNALNQGRSAAKVYRDFMVARVFRLMPAATMVTLITALVLVLVLSEGKTGWTGADWFTRYFEPVKWQALTQALMLQNTLNPVYWSLKAELLGSLVFPAVFLAMNGRKNLWCWTVILLGVAFSWWFRERAPLRFLFCFPLGVLAYNFYAQGSGPRGKWVVPLGVLLFCFSSWLGPRPFAVELEYQYPQTVLEALGAFFIICGVTASPEIDRRLTGPWLAKLGQSSFSLYLVHFVTLELAYLTLVWLFPGFPSTHPYLASLGFIAVTLPLTVFLAGVLYRAVEIPGIEFGRKLVETLRRYD